MDTCARHAQALALAGVALSAVAVLLARRPEVITQPQFYAEDGQAWYADAHNNGFVSLFVPVGGYLNTVQRLVGLACGGMPLQSAALVFGLVALGMQTLPAIMFASSRFRDVIGHDGLRALVAMVYVVMPNPELTGNLTNTQWHLAVLAFLVIVASTPRSRSGRVFDIAVLALSGLSGPYALFLFPIALWRHRDDLRGFRRITVIVLGLTALVQLLILVPSMIVAPRSGAQLGFAADRFFLIVTNQMLTRFTAHAIGPPLLALAVAVAVATVIVLAAGWLRGSSELRAFIAFAVLIAASGLLLPYTRLPQTLPAWQVIATGRAGNRYFFLLSVALALSILAIVATVRGHTHHPGARWWPGVTMAVVMVAASAGAWRYLPLPDENLDHYQAVIDHSPAGTVVSVPIDPTGWSMQVRAG
ncbi:MAG: hypothetical protein ABR498_03790 [Candidatus Dormibacteria bacterium]